MAYFVAQVNQSDMLIGNMQECFDYDSAVVFACSVVRNNDVEVTREVKESINENGYFVPKHGEWSVCIVMPNKGVEKLGPCEQRAFTNFFRRPKTDLPSDSWAYDCITDGVRNLPKPQSITVGLPPGFKGCRLNVVYHDGQTKSMVISKRVAEVIIASGIPTEG